MRITELRAIMPVRASTPSSATKPMGLSARRRAATTPIRPRGATLSTRNRLLKFWSWIISTVRSRMSINGRMAVTDVSALLLASTVPPTAIWYPLGRPAFSAAIFGASACTTVAACVPGTTSACTVTVGRRSRRQNAALYRLLDTMRAYVLEKLAESGAREWLARRHAEYYWDLFARAEIEW